MTPKRKMDAIMVYAPLSLTVESHIILFADGADDD